MAAENLKTTQVSNQDASPKVWNNVQDVQAEVKLAVATLEAAGGDAGSTYRLVRLPAVAAVHKVYLATDDLGTGVTLNVGLYDVTDGAVEDADFFASAVDVATAAVARTDVSYESGVRDIANAGKQLWSELGLTDNEDSRAKEFDVYATSVSAAATGTITVWVEYTLEQ